MIYLNADCMNPETGLPSYPDKYFKLALIDPPYGIGHGRHRHETQKNASSTRKAAWANAKIKEYKPFDDSEIPRADYFRELFRVSENQIIWGGNYFVQYLPPSSNWVAWDKMVSEGELLSQVELAFTSFEGRAKRFQFLWAGFKKGEKTERTHPTQKPLALYRWLLKNYAKAGDNILDTHVGSASSLIAFEEMGFEYVGFELDADYYRDSCKRIEAFRAQPKLFTGKEVFEASKPPTLFE
jgi:site-specific DNA-methyltransferase (adenine-specific)